MSFAVLHISGPVNSQALAPAKYSNSYGRMTGTCSSLVHASQYEAYSQLAYPQVAEFLRVSAWLEEMCHSDLNDLRPHSRAQRLLCRNEGGLQPLNDFVVLDTKQMRWQYPKLAAGNGPSPRNAATLTRIGDKLVLYGGWNPFVETYNDTHVMDVSGIEALRKNFASDPDGEW